jgi:hypothetical protein
MRAASALSEVAGGSVKKGPTFGMQSERRTLDHQEIRVGEREVRFSWAMWTAPPAALPLLS